MGEARQQHLPPHSIAAEQAVLGSLMSSAQAWALISGKLFKQDFYREDHRIIFAAVEGLNLEFQACDLVSVTEFLDRQGALAAAGGFAYIGRIIEHTTSAENVETYAATVRDRSILRKLSVVADKIARSTQAQDGHSAAELVAEAQDQLLRLHGEARTGRGLVSARKLIGEFTDDLDARAHKPRGLELGLADFDQLTGGVGPGDLIVVGARPSMGKTALAVSVGANVSVTVGTAIFSAEMPSEQLMRRCVALFSQIGQMKLRRADRLQDGDWAKISSAASEIAKLHLEIDDTPLPSLTHIRAEVLGLRSRGDIGLILVDYLQLIKGVGKNRYEELREVAYGLKALAKELRVPIIALAQLNRGVESRDHKRPNSSDLRDSGAIEEAADIIALLYSEAYYDPGFAMPYVLECEITKNRNGERGQCLWRFDGATSHVQTLDSGAAAQYRRLLSNKPSRSGDDL